MEWKSLEQEIIKCIKCGSCQSVCPLFKELRSESSVARGKVNLMKQALHGKVGETSGLQEKLSLCLLCKACVANCPSGTRVDKLVLEARGKLAGEKGLPVIKKLILRGFLKNRRLFDLGMKQGSIFQWLLMKKAPNGKGMLPRIPMGLHEKRLLAPVAERPLRSIYPEQIQAASPRGKVAFFTGCTYNYMYPEVGSAIIEVLKKNRISVIMPKNQHCCGTPAHANGDLPTAIELARATLDVFADLDVDAIITGCGSCGATLRKEYMAHFENDPVYRQKAALVAARTMDFSEYLVKIGLEGELKALSTSVTYHESCHLSRGQGIKAQPRQLLKSIPGLELKEMQKPGQCCGAAGSFSLAYYDLSRQVNQRKVDDIVSTKAEMVVTDCPSCIMHIRDGLSQSGHDHRVVHTAQLLMEAYKGS